MNGRGIRLGTIAGINISADAGVLVIGAILAWSFSTELLPIEAPDHVSATYWSVGILGALLFLASLLGHELSHSLIARRNGLKVEGITLWLFGGVARLSGEPPGPGAEFRIAAAGPFASLVIGAALFGSAVGLDAVGGADVWVVMLKWLGIVNAFLALFNLLPGAPLDGGRILGAALWKIRGDAQWGRWAAAKAGQVLGALVILAGFAEMWFTGSLGAIWTVLIGWFLLNAARAEAGFYGAERALAGLTVAGAMITPVQVASTWTTIERAVEGPFTHTSQSAVPVVDGTGQVRGLLLMDTVKRLPAERWATTQCVDVMTPMSDVAVLDPADPMAAALQQLGPFGYGLVIAGRELVGMVGPAEVRRAVEFGGARRRGRGGLVGGPPSPPVGTPTQHWQAPTGPR